MVHLSSVSINGYKGLQSTEIELDNINIITGRNNTGKTSLLESIDLALNPSHLNQYSGHISSLINVEYEEFVIECDFDGDSERVVLSRPDSSKAVKLYSDLLEASFNRDRRRYYIPSPVLEEGWVETLNEVISENIRDIISTLPSEIKEKIAENIYIITHNGREYPYIFFNNYHRDVFEHIRNNKLDEIIEEVKQGIDETNQGGGSLDEAVEHQIQRDLGMLLGEGQFIHSPEGMDQTSFIRSSIIEQDPSDQDEDSAAVKKTRIRDYLRERSIVEGLEDFDFNELVIEDETGERSQIDYEFMGDGFKTIVGILWYIIDDMENNDIILLEEPENHMHPGYIDELVPFLVNVASEEDIQLLITTHNADFISTFLSDSIDQEHQNYLKENLQVVQMTRSVPKILDYQMAKGDLEELHIDLRGI